MYRTVDTALWTDHKGVVRRIVKHKGNPRLKFDVPLHAALRAFVFWRDGYACRFCGKGATSVPEDYDGRYTLMADGVILVIDHILSIRRGGTHSPTNLQTLCDPCNATKSRLCEGSGRNAVQ